MRVFSPGWNFSPVKRAENSALLCSHLFVKLSLRLHEIVSALLELGGLGFPARVNGLRFLM